MEEDYCLRGKMNLFEERESQGGIFGKKLKHIFCIQSGDFYSFPIPNAQFMQIWKKKNDGQQTITARPRQ